VGIVIVLKFTVLCCSKKSTSWNNEIPTEHVGCGGFTRTTHSIVMHRGQIITT